jgi:hypothetical protein
MPEWGFPETWTISLGISETRIIDGTDYNGRNITALIEFGVGGFTQTIECDWKLGTQVTVVTNSINVIAQFANVDVAAGEGDFKLSVQVCRGNRPSSAVAPTKVLVATDPFGSLPVNTFLEAVTLAPGETTGSVSIPKFATMLHFIPAGLGTNELYNATTDITVFSGPGLLHKAVVHMKGPDLLAAGSKIPVFGSAMEVKVSTPDQFVSFSAFAELAG